MTEHPFTHTATTDDRFDERNSFLDALLGLISVAERTLATAVDIAPAPPAAPPPRPAGKRPPPTGSLLR